MSRVFLRPAAALAAAVVLAACQGPPPPPPAPAADDHAEVEALARADFRRVSCRQAIADKELFDAVMIWVDGYAHGRSGQARTTPRDVSGHKDAFVAQCTRTPDASVQDVVTAITRPPRRAVRAAPPAAAPAATPPGTPATR